MGTRRKTFLTSTNTVYFKHSNWRSNRWLFHQNQHAKITQSICSIHQVTCEIHLILESHDLKGLVSFWPCPPTNFFITAIWLPHGHLWAAVEGAASLTRSLCWILDFTRRSPKAFKKDWFPNLGRVPWWVSKLAFSFPRFLSAWKRLAPFKNSFLRYSRF